MENSFIRPVNLKEIDGSFDLLMKFNKEIKIYDTEEKMRTTIEKFFELGNPIGIIKDGEVIAYFNLYCNNTETLEAYLGNLYVLEKYRRQGIARALVNEAFQFTQNRGFEKVVLHVGKDNIPAIKLYEECGFKKTGATKIIANEDTYEMKKVL